MRSDSDHGKAAGVNFEPRGSTNEDQQESPSLSLSLHFTRAQFVASHAHSQPVHSAAARPLSTALYNKEREG